MVSVVPSPELKPEKGAGDGTMAETIISADESAPAPLKASRASDRDETTKASDNQQSADTTPAEQPAIASEEPSSSGKSQWNPDPIKPGIDGNKDGRLVNSTDEAAMPEHMFYVFNMWPVLRPGLKEFLVMLREHREDPNSAVKGIYIYTANTSLEWVKFIMTAMIEYYNLPLDTFDGIRHSPGGLKLVESNGVLYDDHPENVEGNCVPVDPYHNDIPWSLLEPVVRQLPDDGKGGLNSYIEKDKSYKDVVHEKDSDATLFEFAEEGIEEGMEEVLLDLDETLIAGARSSAYFFALNHFLKFNNK